MENGDRVHEYEHLQVIKMKFEVSLFIETKEEMDEATLDMYIASQLMGGPLETNVIAYCLEIDEFEDDTWANGE